MWRPVCSLHGDRLNLGSACAPFCKQCKIFWPVFVSAPSPLPRHNVTLADWSQSAQYQHPVMCCLPLLSSSPFFCAAVERCVPARAVWGSADWVKHHEATRKWILTADITLASCYLQNCLLFTTGTNNHSFISAQLFLPCFVSVQETSAVLFHVSSVRRCTWQRVRSHNMCVPAERASCSLAMLWY